MKKLYLSALMLVAAGGAFAQAAQPTVSTQQTGVAAGTTSNSAAGAAAQVTGNTTQGVNGNICVGQCVAQDTANRDLTDLQIAGIQAAAALEIAKGNQQAARDVAGTTQTIKNTPSVSGPQLVTSNDTCMGSTSGSANVPGIGIGFGTSWVDENCKMLKNSRELWNMGMKGAAMALMCNDKANREALELTGFECPQTTRDRQAAAAKAAPVAAASAAGEPTDPIVRARLGLKPL